nr:WD-repeat protein [Cryptococcus depauperatus CBS 7855]
MPTPPTPFHTFRHSSPLSAIVFSPDNTLLYCGDQDGYISVLDLGVRRVVGWWKAHEGGVLGVAELKGGLISHGRDNLIHFYEPLKKPYIPVPTLVISSRSKGEAPPITKSLPTNALNFCRFSHVTLHSGKTLDRKGKDKEGIMAVPGLVDSELVDIYHIPSFRRLHASINLSSKPTPQPSAADLPGASRSGLVMSLHLFFPPPSSSDEELVGLVVAYEDGRLEVFSAPISSLEQQYDARLSQRPNPWTVRWSGKGHNEAIMAAGVDSNGSRAWSVSADHRLVRYEFAEVWKGEREKNDEAVMKPYATKQIGNSSISISADDKVVAVGGWDGKIRLFSAATSKPLGSLSSHRETVHAIAFAHHSPMPPVDVEDPESTIDLAEESDEEVENKRERWMASGGKDGKVALWSLMDFSCRV